ncbi:AMP-binding protein [Streptomyces sp. NPDC051018]|uniref:AMP-binding protein n=1 Tax=Streptomyces sp. NPDC051018 TaxID=3365639 RepID=UPI0037B9ECD2
MSLPEFVLRGAADRADRPALVDGRTGEQLSYRQLAHHVDRFAAALVSRGLRRGDVVAILCPNSIWYPVVFLGAAAAGAVSTTMNPAYTTTEIAHQLRDSRARVLVTVAAAVDRAEAAVGDGTSVEELVVVDGAGERLTLAGLLATEAPSATVPVEPAVDLAALPYSSGTTGLPKGVMLTHRNLVANIAQLRPTSTLASGAERVLAVLPFFHIYGLTVLMNLGLQTGSTIVTMPRFDIESFLGAVQSHRITRAYVVPPIVLALNKHPALHRYDLSSLRSITSGAAPLDEALAHTCEERLGGAVDVLQGYGMTELSPVSHISPDPGLQPAGAPRAPKGSIGYALPGTECRVVDVESGADVASGGAGELWIRGPQVMSGYLDRPEATAATIDPAGWLHTGDMVVVDADSCFTIVDRLKELIKYKGFQVAPAELEATLLRHPDVLDAAVVGVPDDVGGEAPKAFVVRRPGSGLTADAVLVHVATAVAPHKRVKHVSFVEEIPRSPSGKILRRRLRSGC